MAKKKRSSTTPSEIPENKQEPVPEKKNKKQSPAPNKAGNEIDEIFAGMKRKKTEPKSTEKPNGEEKSKPKSSKKKRSTESKENRDEGFSESSSRPRRKTADGFTIYTEEELGIGKSDAGNTPLCPFDCDCCF
ncbi:hypothetical protein F3Y22_tig00112800pilonHSYRG00102 [Hibiscus syriacus]|uniref:Uncharacterized protein n=1 Tax=Hibiscus syriacus TaxID=106335 RepID=A0A6A2Y316_HIBSY|nr:uncharacterized protein C6G9.01c-like [Hibiscus syriacus]XP_039044210.1 uncharacterized protein C6G9.01c-like [Hibiscus syriacus]KAE8664387.1 hypothetical protein F3Y22_tig00112800pilonHSYRG00102 [Hibiscus syriacus]